MAGARTDRARRPAGMQPLSPQHKWRAITAATIVLVPACWMILAGVVTGAADEPGGVERPAAAIAFGLALVPFVFLTLAFASQHPTAAAATVRAMGLCAAVGVPVSAVAADAVTGIVAGVGAGGIAALRSDEGHTQRSRAVAVLVAAAYTFVLARVAGAVVLVSAPIFPFTAIGVADHVVERRRARHTES